MKAVVCGTASKQLGTNIAKLLGAKLVPVEYKRFPDSECYVRILNDLEGKEVFLVQSTYPDEKIIELFLLQDAINEYEVEKLTAIVPYFGYARQDKKFLEGEPISARALAGHLELDADELITVDIHAETVLDWFTIDATNVSAMPAIGRYLAKKNVDLIVAPDKGGVERTKKASEAANCDIDYLEKKRIDSTQVRYELVNFEVTNKSIAIVDDIISTGGTMLAAAEYLKKLGAKQIFVACTHGLFVGNSLQKLHMCCEEVISTNTVMNETSKVCVAPEIISALK
jgi:ribose-phosphate pyrophosphokinase